MRLTDDTTLYSRVASGFRPGGANDFRTRPAQQGVIAPAEYEFGHAVELRGRREELLRSIRVVHRTVGVSHRLVRSADLGDRSRWHVRVHRATPVRATSTAWSCRSTVSPPIALSLNLGATYTDSRLSEDMPIPPIPGARQQPNPTQPRTASMAIAFRTAPKWALAGSGARTKSRSRRTVTGYAEHQLQLSERVVHGVQQHLRPDQLSGAGQTTSLMGVRFGVRCGGWDTSIFVDNVTDEVPRSGSARDGRRLSCLHGAAVDRGSCAFRRTSEPIGKCGGRSCSGAAAFAGP